MTEPEDPTEAEKNAILARWSAQLRTALGLEDLEVDIDSVLGLAGIAARSVVRPAAPLTTFLVGYAAGLAAGNGTATPNAAFDHAANVARALAQQPGNGA